MSKHAALPTSVVHLGILCVRYSIVYIVLHNETLWRPSGVLVTVSAPMAILRKKWFSAAKPQVFLYLFDSNKLLPVTWCSCSEYILNRMSTCD